MEEKLHLARRRAILPGTTNHPSSSPANGAATADDRRDVIPAGVSQPRSLLLNRAGREPGHIISLNCSEDPVTVPELVEHRQGRQSFPIEPGGGDAEAE